MLLYWCKQYCYITYSIYNHLKNYSFKMVDFGSVISISNDLKNVAVLLSVYECMLYIVAANHYLPAVSLSF